MAALIAGALAASSDKGALKYRSMDILLDMAGLCILVGASVMVVFGSCCEMGSRTWSSVDPNCCINEAESIKLFSMLNEWQ
jgi:hypothetical protein